MCLAERRVALKDGAKVWSKGVNGTLGRHHESKLVVSTEAVMTRMSAVDPASSMITVDAQAIALHIIAQNGLG